MIASGTVISIHKPCKQRPCAAAATNDDLWAASRTVNKGVPAGPAELNVLLPRDGKAERGLGRRGGAVCAGLKVAVGGRRAGRAGRLVGAAGEIAQLVREVHAQQVRGESGRRGAPGRVSQQLPGALRGSPDLPVLGRRCRPAARAPACDRSAQQSMLENTRVMRGPACTGEAKHTLRKSPGARHCLAAQACCQLRHMATCTGCRARACMMRTTTAASGTVRAKTDTQSSERHAGTTPSVDVRPTVGLMPTQPQKCAGTRPACQHHCQKHAAQVMHGSACRLATEHTCEIFCRAKQEKVRLSTIY